MNQTNRAFRVLRIALLAASLPMLAGCFSFDLAIRVKPDGSGTLVETMAMNTEWIAQFAAMIDAMGDEKDRPKKRKDGSFEFFTVEEAKKKAAEFGEGVRFVSAEPFRKGAFEGMRATYAFSDVTKLALSETPKAPMPGASPGEAKPDEKKMNVRFQKGTAGKPASLVVRLADSPPKIEPKTSDAAAAEPSTPPTKEELEQARKLIGGMRFAMTVEVLGTLVETNSPFVEGKTVTLFEMDFDKLLSDEKALRKLSALDNRSLADARREFAGVPGFRIPATDEIRIVFK